MIATIDIKVNAAHPNIPLAPLYAFVGSPSSVRVLNVPQRVGKWQIDAVSVTIAMPDNSSTTVPAVAVCGCWVATLPSCDVTGYCASGLQITASGTDENGAAVSGYCLGVGDVTILPRDATAVSNGTRYYLHYVAEQPTNPNPGDMCYIDGAPKWYDGTAWQTFAAGGASIVVVPPSTDPADEGKAADAKATGDALAGKLSKAEAEAGFTEWTCVPATLGGKPITLEYDSSLGWFPCVDGEHVGTENEAEADATTLVWRGTSSSEEGSTWAGDVDLTATRTRLPTMADIPTKTSDLTNNGSDGAHPFISQNEVQHQQLALRGPNHDGYSAWTILRDGVDVTAQVEQPHYIEDGQYWDANPSTIEDQADADIQALPTATSLSWTAQTDDDPPVVVSYVATRTVLPGYVLGTQTDKPLQPQGDYAPATNIAKTALASGVQASLGKADTAVQPSALAGYATTAQLTQKADASALRYDIGTETAISSASSEVIEGETVTYGDMTLADRTANIVAITAAIAELRLAFPASVSGKVRDFGLRVEVGTGSAALAAPALVPPAGVTLENSDGAIPALADGTATAVGVTLLYFSETAPGKFLVKGEEAKEVS